MKYSWKKPSSEDYIGIMQGYYDFLEQNFGTSVFRKISVKNIQNGNLSSKVSFLDENYKRAGEIVDTIKTGENIQFLTIYDDNHHPFAYSRISTCAGGDDENAIVGEIVVLHFLDEEARQTFYKETICYIESVLEVVSPSITVLTFEVPQTDYPYFNAVQECGYTLLQEPARDYQLAKTYLFDKNIRDIDSKRKLSK